MNLKQQALVYYHKYSWWVIPAKGKIPLIKWLDIEVTEENIEKWWTQYPDGNIALLTGFRSGVVVLDVDGADISNLLLPETAVATTTEGHYHYYFKYPGFTVNNSAGQLDKGLDFRGDGGVCILPPSQHFDKTGKPDVKYTWLKKPSVVGIAEMPQWLIEKVKEGKGNNIGDKFDWSYAVDVAEGSRDGTLYKAACSLLGKGFSTDLALTILKGVNATYRPPLADEIVLEKLKGAANFLESQGSKLAEKAESFKHHSSWVSPLNETAYHGLVGRLVKLIEPETEADPTAVLVGTLTAFGSIIGRGAYLVVGPVQHYLKLFTAVVGKSSKARKGVALAEVRRIFEGIDTNWEEGCIVPSCSTGEGIIHALRDVTTKIDENGEEKVVDPGVDDKRLFVEGDELASTLQTMARPGNTLSPLIRLAWDKGNLRSLTKNNAEKASDTHVVILANITEVELKKLLTEVDLNNGLANRFLFIVAKRARELPLGGKVSEFELMVLKKELAKAIEFGKTAGKVTFDTRAEQAWIKIYHDLTSEIPGLVGVLSARTEAYTLRIAAIYALLDCSNKIQLPHLRAALAVMDYVTETLFYLFGGSTGDPVAERILNELSKRPEGLSREAIREIFQRNKPSAEISLKLDQLKNIGWIKDKTEKTEGRDKTIYTLSASTAFTAYGNNHQSYLKKFDAYLKELGLDKNLTTVTTTLDAGEKSNAVNAKNAESPTIIVKATKVSKEFNTFAPIPEDMKTTRKGKLTPMVIGQIRGLDKTVKAIAGVPENLEEL